MAFCKKLNELFASFERKSIDTLIALLPLLLFGVILFGFKALIVCLVCVTATVIFDYFLSSVLKENKVDYIKSIISGLLLGLILPPALPLYIAVIGCAFSSFVVKLILICKEGFVVSPALISRIFLQLSFPTQMSYYIEPMTDVKASATPLTDNIYSIKELLFGVISGSIGETASILIVLCGLYLISIKAISWEIPLSYIGAAFITSLIFDNNSFLSCMFGGLLFASFFLEVDGIGLPQNRFGKLIFGCGCGFLTAFIRAFSTFPEGVAYAVTIVGLIVPLIVKIRLTKVGNESD